MSGALDRVEVEALITDRYLEALLVATERRALDAPTDPALDPAIRAAARRLRDELFRAHPSFRFEDRLARRLADAAAGMRRTAATGGDATVLPFPSKTLADADLPPGRRPLFVGGAVTSAALGLAGVALVAWRLTRGAPADPMARAVRRARAARPVRHIVPRGLA